MLLLTASNEHQIPLAELTVPLMREYAKRHRLGFRYVPFAEPNVKEAYWKKITLTLQAFDEGFDRVFWLDVDQAITNMEFSLFRHYPENGFYVSRDWGNDAGVEDFSMCGYLACSANRGVFEAVDARHDEYINGPFPEQTPMRIALKGSSELHMQSRRWLNAVPDEVSPGNVPEPWQPGDFAAHLTHLPIDQRVTLFHKIMARI